MHKTLLGPYGEATVVLFTSQFETQLPKLAQIKKQLGITDGKYFSSNGNFDLPIAALDEAVATARNGGRPLGIHRRAIDCTHVLVTVADVHADLFALIKYSADLLEGFNLTEPAMKELTDLLNRRRQIAWMRHACSDWTETLTKHIARAQDLGLTDPSILNVDINAISAITDPYALEAIAQASNEIVVWYERYRWRTAKTVANNLADEADSDLGPEIADAQMA